MSVAPPPPPYLTQTDYAIVVNAMQQFIALLNNNLLDNFTLTAAYEPFPELNAAYQTAIGTVALNQYTAILTTLQTLASLAPTS